MEDEEQKKEEVQEKPTEENPETSVSQLELLADRIEKGNEEAKKIVEEQKEMAASKILGGKTEFVPEEKPKEQTAREYAEEVISGKHNG